jgi:chromosome segregation ATPase
VFEDDDDHPSSEGDSAKRQRRHHNIDNLKEEEDDDQDSETETEGSDDNPPPSTQRHRIRPQVNGKLGATSSNVEGDYQPGAIVRVKVKDFVTYEHAEFFPGPNLNMVIGPNGTGKSSLVCAICLGLGYSVKTLGRADKLGEFVKHGKDASTIEIELQRRPNERTNHLIRVQITKETNRQTWWLNGKTSTQKDIQSLMKKLRIQIDNLCQFLPQDRVVEFAALTPIQLLHETLRAAAPEKMINWQSQLKDYHHDYKKVKELVDSTSETLRGHETRQQGLQADVDRLNERDAIKLHIEEMQKARSCAEYTIARDRYKEANKKKKESERRLKDLEKACGPALQAVKLKEKYRAKVEAVLEERKRVLKRAEATVDQEVRAIEAHDEKIKNCEAQSTAETQSFKARKDEITKSRRTLTGLETTMKQKPAPFVAGEWNLKIVGCLDVYLMKLH